MVKLTAELIQMSPQYINPVRDRQLVLRGPGELPLEKFDSIDFSDNDIRKLDGFPQLKRIKTLLMNNNRICRIADNLQESLPNLDQLVLTSNHIAELGDIDPLSTLPKLTTLCLLKNPITSKRHYRLYVIHKLPHLRLLDFRKVKQKERDESAVLFKGKKGKLLEKEIGKKSKTFVPGGNLPKSATKDKSNKPTVHDVEAIREAIQKATSLEEVERLKQMLKTGQIPKKEVVSSSSQDAEDEEMDTEPSANGNN